MTYQFEVLGGRRLRVARWGSARSRHRPLLVFNGIGTNLEMLEPVVEALAGRRVLAFDMPGTGQSPDPLVPYNAATMAWTACKLLDLDGIDQADVLGISWGGGMAQQLAVQHPARVGRLVLAATSAGMAMVPGELSAIQRLFDPAEYAPEAALRRNLAAVWNGGGDAVPLSMAGMSPPSPMGLAYQFAAMFGWTSLPLLPLITVPTLVIAGEEDHIVPPINARLLQTLIPDSELTIVPRGGHLFPFTDPAAFAGHLTRFLGAKEPATA